MADLMQPTNSLLAGMAAGTAVDVILFPLDTIKTRLQSQQGFWKTGGFSGIYRGLGPAFAGSAPNAGIFFLTYDSCKTLFQMKGYDGPVVHMLSASMGEVMACTIRVPIEILKQRSQASKKSTDEILLKIFRQERVVGLYRGYLSTIIREIPFSVIQFPIWEYLKIIWERRKGDNETVSPFESSLCGALAGGFAAAVTTPLDVAKTRIMLAEVNTREAKGNVIEVLGTIFKQKGVKGIFAGVVPRTLWISVGGSIFFGTYELVKGYLQ